MSTFIIDLVIHQLILRPFSNPLHFTYGMFSDYSHWNKVRRKQCSNNEKHSTSEQLENVAGCKSYCLKRDWCIGVSFSSYWVRRVGYSKCYFCYDAANKASTPNYDIYIRPGNPELIVF